MAYSKFSLYFFKLFVGDSFLLFSLCIVIIKHEVKHDGVASGFQWDIRRRHAITSPSHVSQLDQYMPKDILNQYIINPMYYRVEKYTINLKIFKYNPVKCKLRKLIKKHVI